MTEAEFCRFFHAVHQHEPFHWQRQLAGQVLAGEWPDSLALPTASGKTAILDIAVFALAAQASRPLGERRAALRIFYVVDRRLVVDEAAEHARALSVELAQALHNPGADPAVRWVARQLASFGGRLPLTVAALHGGLYRDDTWTLAPHQPTICVCTVDQIGSRLLFRGYGLSEQRWPVHAGLVGSDALVVLDEAHLSAAFAETLREVARYQTWAERPVTPPLRVLTMSATLGATSSAFHLPEADRQPEAPLARRLTASKPAKLLDEGDLEAAAAALAVRFAQPEDVRVVGVVVNRVASARQIFTALKENGEAILLTGRIRPYDRDTLLAQYLPRIGVKRERGPRQGAPLFVVATQCVEVGANLDFDALITECAPLPALRQRFGRLDRLGERGRSDAAILWRKPRRAGADPIYGEETERTWQWLCRRATAGAKGSRCIDFGTAAMDSLIASDPEVPWPAPAPAPALLPAHVDLWVQTSPAPQPSPDVAPFLHGADARAGADVQVVWRADLDAAPPAVWREIAALAPPLKRETLPVPLWAVRAWLQRHEASAGQTGDVEGLGTEPESDASGGRPVLVWLGPDSPKTRTVYDPEELGPGDTIVVPSGYGGTDAFGWDPASHAPVSDVADLCHNQRALQAGAGSRRRVRLRLHPAVVKALPGAANDEAMQAGMASDLKDLAQALRAEDTGDDAVAEAVRSVLERWREPLAGLMPQAAVWEALTHPQRVVAYPTTPGEQPAGVVLLATLPPDTPGDPSGEDVDPDLTDEDETASLTRPVALAEHLEHVTDKVRAFATGCGLSPELTADLVLAASAHDLGKVDERFQLWLHAGAWSRVDPARPLAKSGMPRQDPSTVRRARLAARLPEGWRHEFASVALLSSAPDPLAGACDPELVRYLIGTHHGRGRPWVPVVADPVPPPLTAAWAGRRLTAPGAHGLQRADSGWVDSFWRLVRRYGPWGLAYLEAILRLADQAASREEEMTP